MTSTKLPTQWTEEEFTSLTVRASRVKVPKAPKSDYQERGKFPVVDQGQDLVVGFVDDDELLFPGQVPVIVFGDHTRILKYVDFPFVVGADGTQLIVPASERLDIRFFYYALTNLPIRNLGYSRHFRLLKEQLVRFPENLTEQRKIAAILSSVDAAIEKTQAVIDQVQVVKNGLMQELLTRGVPGRHTRFKQTEIGEIPEEWEVCQLDGLCERMFVGIAQAATHAYAERGVPLIRTTNVRANYLEVDDLLFITEQFAEEMGKKALRGGDVLTARTGYPGTSVVVPESLSGAQCFTLLVSRPGPRLRSAYLCHAMNSSHGKRIVSRGQAGGAQQNLNVTVFKKALFGLPSVEEQDAICDVLDACYVLVDKQESRKEALQVVKSGLMSVLLTGELRVTSDTEAA